MTVVKDWSKRFESVCKKKRDNGDETGLFYSYRTLPTRLITVKGNDAKGGKKSKDGISTLVVVLPIESRKFSNYCGNPYVEGLG